MAWRGGGAFDYEANEWTVVPYLLANGVRLARVAYEPDAPKVTYTPDSDKPPEQQLGYVSQNDEAEGGLHVLFELGDHLGSTSVVLDKATGELVERSTFQAYGGSESDYRPERWGAFREDYKFTGKEEDVAVGLQYFGKRYLNPLLGRWISADPLAVYSPEEADLNLYAYVEAQVLKATDPLGLKKTTIKTWGEKGPRESSIEIGDRRTDVAESPASDNEAGTHDPFAGENLEPAEKESAGKELPTAEETLNVLAGGSEEKGKAKHGSGHGTCPEGASHCLDTKEASMALNLAVIAETLYSIGTGVVGGVKAMGRWLSKKAGPAIGRGFKSLWDRGVKFFRGGCFVGGTLVATQTGAQPIEDVELGQRLAVYDAECVGLPRDGWTELGFIAHDDGQAVVVRLLRPPWWVQEQELAVGQDLFVESEELGDFSGVLVSVVDGVVLEAGNGCPVTGTSRRMADRLVEIWLDGGEGPLEATHEHPIFSKTRGAWVAAGELEAGEVLETSTGEATVRQVVTSRNEPQIVFNLEVAVAHEYNVGPQRVRVHNSCPKPKATKGIGSASRHPLSAVNPLGGTTNCVNCAVAVNATLSGSRASAVLGKAVPLNRVPGVFGRSGFDGAANSIAGVENALLNAGSGSRAVVVGIGPNGGHAFNAVNRGGAIQLLDGQAGGAASVNGFTSFRWILNP